MDPEDPTVIAETELLGAAASIEAAAKKLEQLKPRAKPKVSFHPSSESKHTHTHTLANTTISDHFHQRLRECFILILYSGEVLFFVLFFILGPQNFRMWSFCTFMLLGKCAHICVAFYMGFFVVIFVLHINNLIF